MLYRTACGLLFAAALGYSQTAPDAALKQRQDGPAPPNSYVVAAGTHVLLRVVNGISTKNAEVGSKLYLRTAFPVLANGHVVIPEGSYVNGTVIEVKKPGRARGRGEMRVQFDDIILPNGISRNLHSDLGGLDGMNTGTLDREKSTIKGPGDKKSDAGQVIQTTAEGAAIGTGIGAAAGHIGGGSVIGLGAGAAAGIIGVLLSRGPDATMQAGSTVEMVLDRAVAFKADEIPAQTIVHEQMIQVPAAESNRPRGFTPFPQ